MSCIRPRTSKLGWVVALTLLKSEALDAEEAKKRFLREARAAAAVEHSNLCAIYDSDEKDGPDQGLVGSGTFIALGLAGR